MHTGVSQCPGSSIERFHSPTHTHTHTHTHAQAESVEDELDTLQSQHSELLEQLEEREEILRRLEQETSFLKEQHASSQSEVRQALVATCVHMYVVDGARGGCKLDVCGAHVLTKPRLS